MDDLIAVGSEEFSNFTKKTSQRFDAKSREIGKANSWEWSTMRQKGRD